MKQWGRLCIAAVVALIHGACAAPAIVMTASLGALQTGTEAFIRGELESTVAHPMQEVFRATQAALLELEFPIRRADIGDANAYVVSAEAQGRKINVSLELKSPLVTKLNIRVGVFGDQTVSRLILAAIQAQLEHEGSHIGVVPLGPG